MATVYELLHCAISNLNNPISKIGVILAKAQIQQYMDLKEAGADDEDDTDDSVDKYPECSLKCNFN